MRWGLLVGLWTVCASALAQPYPHTPKQGSEERKAILNTLRYPVEKRLKRKVVFKVDWIKVQGQWAFFKGVPQQPGGKKMDYRGTPYAAAIKDGVFDDWVCALFKNANGKWSVVAHVLGATDVPYVGWWKEFKAPKTIFDYVE